MISQAFKDHAMRFEGGGSGCQQSAAAAVIVRRLPKGERRYLCQKTDWMPSILPARLSLCRHHLQQQKSSGDEGKRLG